LWRDVDYYIFWNSFEIICGLGLQVSQLRNQFYFMVRGVDAPREDTWKSSAQQDERDLHYSRVVPKASVIACAAEWLRARALNQAD